MGGALFGLAAGYLLGHGFGYQTLFMLVGSFHIVGFLAIVLFGGTIQPLSSHDLKEIEARE
jgi:ACS family hexuronate transporter-like MFS transporter